MNCRSRAEGLARRLQTGLCATLGPAGAQPGAALDQAAATLLHQPYEDPDHFTVIGYRKSSLCDSGDLPFDLQPLHVVTSEPSLHLCLAKATQNDLLLVRDEQDSDSHYDFGVEDSPEDPKESISGTQCGQAPGGLDCEGDRPESGCVTQITSPDLCAASSINNGHSDGQGGIPPDVIPRIPDIDLQEVSQLLSSSSINESNNDSCDESQCYTNPSPLSLSYHEDAYEKLTPTPCHTGPSSPRWGRSSPLPDCGYVSPRMDTNKNMSSPAAATAESAATCMSSVGGAAGDDAPPPVPPGGRGGGQCSLSPGHGAATASGACWCRPSDNNATVPNCDSNIDVCACDSGDIDINEYCSCDDNDNQSDVHDDSCHSGDGDGGLLMAEAFRGHPYAIEGQTSEKCQNNDITDDIVSECGNKSDADSANTANNLSVLAATDSSSRNYEGGSTGVEGVKVETGGSCTTPPPVSLPVTNSSIYDLQPSLTPAIVENRVPNMNPCHLQTEGPCDKVNDEKCVSQDADQEESITTLSEDELREVEAEDNDEDVDEEAIITGKFRNILRYQERVRRISEDECPTAPAIPGVSKRNAGCSIPVLEVGFPTCNDSSSMPVLEINDPCGLDISISEPYRPMESSNQNLDISITSVDSERRNSLESDKKVSYGGYRKYSDRRRRSLQDAKREPESPSSGSITPIGVSGLEFISSLDVPECHFDVHTPPLPPNTLPPPSDTTPDDESEEDISELEPEYYENLPEAKEDLSHSVTEKVMNIEELTKELEQLKAEDDIDDQQICDIDIDVEPPSNQSSRETSEEPDSEKIEEYRNSMKRSSSLKYTKTPPGTPGTKKILKFADALGLDLAEVRTFVDGIPHIPKSAFWDLPDKDKEEEMCTTATSSKAVPSVLPPLRILSPLFRNPVDLVEFPTILETQKVCLERVIVGNDLSVKGVVRVMNLAFDKRIIIRYTFDQWKNIHEATGTYIPGSSTGDSDQFAFLLWGSFLQDNGTLVFCVLYQTCGQDLWDNNRGSNYTLHCSTPLQHQQRPDLTDVPCLIVNECSSDSKDDETYESDSMSSCDIEEQPPKKVEKESILRKTSDEAEKQRNESKQLKKTLELLKMNSDEMLIVKPPETLSTSNNQTNEQPTIKERQPFSRRRRLNKPNPNAQIEISPTPFSY
ncbi:unnamed protein product [Meganyctiphanes norvegica]|uniref:CBM21 domain-containing protein n=1 Tax=Meganyctiphanes norvegica TaxID=48144 RepID=A0AAV2QKV4_MEGNR